MIMGIGGHWVFTFWGDWSFYIENRKRRVPACEASTCHGAYVNTALYLANRVNRDRLMMSYARKKGRSINSKKGRKPRITYIAFDSRKHPVAITLGGCASTRYLDGRPFNKRFRPAR